MKGGGLSELDIGLTGALMITGAGMLPPMLGCQRALLQLAGLVLIPYVTFVAIFAARAHIPAAAVRAIVACNVVWTVASFTVDRCHRYADDAGIIFVVDRLLQSGAGRPAIRGAVPPANLYCVLIVSTAATSCCNASGSSVMTPSCLRPTSRGDKPELSYSHASSA